MATLASKRKRESGDMPHARAAPGMGGAEYDQHYLNTAGDAMDHNDPAMDFAAALAQHNAGHQQQMSELPLPHQLQQLAHQQQHAHPQHQPGHLAVQEPTHDNADTAAAAMAQYHTMTVPQSTEQAFMANAPPSEERPESASMDQGNAGGQPRTSSFGDFDISGIKDGQAPENGETSPTLGANQTTPKPQVGTDEWHKVRRDNHKEVERRRRETINEGINELAKIVPGCEKNKGSILGRAVQFITQLKENETQNIEKWTLEKLLTEQAIAELSSSCDKLKAECQRAWAECEQWKKAAQRAGATVEDEKHDAEEEEGE